MPAAVLLDVDGTLVDTNYLHIHAWTGAFQAVGLAVPSWRLHRHVGMGADRFVEAVCGEDRDDVADLWQERFADLRDQTRALPGAADLIRALAERQATVVLATSGLPEDVEHFRSVLGADDHIDAEVNSSEVDESKPDPAIFQLALERAGVEPADAAVVGDTVWDAKAAAACGVTFVGVRSGGISDAELLDAGAAAVYDDPAAVLADLESGPLAPLFASTSLGTEERTSQ